MQGLRPASRPRNSSISGNPAPPRTIDGNPDPNSCSPRHTGLRQPPVLDAQLAAGEILAVLVQGDPERSGEITGPATQLVKGNRASGRSPTRLHQLDPIYGFERPNQDGGRRALGLCHSVDEVVNTVSQVHVRDTRRTVERLVAPCRARCRMTRRIGFTDVRLGFDDHASGDACRAAMHQHLAEQILRDDQRRTFIEVPRKDRCRVRGRMVIRAPRTHWCGPMRAHRGARRPYAMRDSARPVPACRARSHDRPPLRLRARDRSSNRPS